MAAAAVRRQRIAGIRPKSMPLTARLLLLLHLLVRQLLGSQRAAVSQQHPAAAKEKVLPTAAVAVNVAMAAAAATMKAAAVAKAVPRLSSSSSSQQRPRLQVKMLLLQLALLLLRTLTQQTKV